MKNKTEYYEDQTYIDPKSKTIPMYDPTSGETLDVPLSAINFEDKKTWLKHEIIELIDDRIKELGVRTIVQSDKSNL